MIRLPSLKAVDNDAWLWAKVGATTWFDTLGVARKRARYEEVFRGVETFVLFVGYPRSGHSVVGSVIDAHPNALMAHRLDALKYLQAGFALHDVYYLILQNARRFARSGRKLTAYRYYIPDARQGGFDTLRVIGDQEGKWTTLRLSDTPELLDALLDRSDVRVRFVHVVRNPYDNIATWARRTGRDLEATSRQYFDLCDRVDHVLGRVDPDRVLRVRHETFIGDFARSLDDLCAFLGLSCGADYASACGRMVYGNPNRSRYDAIWPPDLIERVRRRIEGFDFLSGYRYDDA